jgi:hypothetical protein
MRARRSLNAVNVSPSVYDDERRSISTVDSLSRNEIGARPFVYNKNEIGDYAEA